MKKYIKPSMEIIEMNSDVAILAASPGTPSTDLKTDFIEGTDAQAREMRNFSLWDDAEE